MNKISNEPNGEVINQTTDTNFNNNQIKKRPKMKIGKQLEKDGYKLKRLNNGDEKNEFVNVEDEKKNEDIVLKAMQDKWYIKFTRLIYSKNYSYLYLTSATCLLILFMISVLCYIYDLRDFVVISCTILLTIFLIFSLFDIIIRIYIMVCLL